MSVLDDDLLDGDDGDESLDDGAESPSPSDKDLKSTEKRVTDLQSKMDKETARANKAEKTLLILQETMKGDDTEESNSGSRDSESNQDSVVLDMARMFALQQHPILSEYGISVADLTGSTPSEIAQTATELEARFAKIETQVRNKVLADNGMSPEIDAGDKSKNRSSRDFSKMSSEDFNKVLTEVLAAR